MNKAEYLQTLRQELQGLPPDLIQDTLWTYEGKFVDAMLRGKSEEEIVMILPRPQLVAAQKRVKLQFANVRKHASFANLIRFLIALVGVVILNFLMIIPAALYTAGVTAAYVLAITVYVSGIGMSAASLSGVHEYHAQFPSAIEISAMTEDERNSQPVHHVNMTISPLHFTSKTVAANKETTSPAEKVIDNSPGTHVDIVNQLQPVHAVYGIAIIITGIALLMLCLIVTRYSLRGFKRYLNWNLSLLRLSATA